MRKVWVAFILVLLIGCQSHGLFVHRQRLNSSYWASTHVGSPDFRAEQPLKGEMIIAEWWVPGALLSEKPTLKMDLIFHNFETRTIEFPICQRVGYQTYAIANEYFEHTGGVLTYKAEIVTQNGEVYRSWKQQLYVELITIDEES